MGFLLGSIVTTVVVNYFVISPMKKNIEQAKTLIKDVLAFLLEIQSLQDTVDKDTEGNIKSPIQFGRKGS